MSLPAAGNRGQGGPGQNEEEDCESSLPRDQPLGLWPCHTITVIPAIGYLLILQLSLTTFCTRDRK